MLLVADFSLLSLEYIMLGVSAEKSADNLMGIPLCVIRCFSLDASIFRLCLPFLCLITLCLDTFPRGFLRGTLCTS